MGLRDIVTWLFFSEEISLKIVQNHCLHTCRFSHVCQQVLGCLICHYGSSVNVLEGEGVDTMSTFSWIPFHEHLLLEKITCKEDSELFDPIKSFPDHDTTHNQYLDWQRKYQSNTEDCSSSSFYKSFLLITTTIQTHCNTICVECCCTKKPPEAGPVCSYYIILYMFYIVQHLYNMY